LLIAGAALAHEGATAVLAERMKPMEYTAAQAKALDRALKASSPWAEVRACAERIHAHNPIILLRRVQQVYAGHCSPAQEGDVPSVSRLALLVGGVLLISSAFNANADPVVYATGGVGTDLLAIDAKTGETKVIGSFGYAGSAPLAFGTDGKLYTVTDSMRHENPRSQLATVDLSTGKATPIGEPLDKTVRIMALGPGPDGGLYASGVMENRLYQIDPQSGVFTEIGPFEGGRDVMDFAINPMDGAMYATTTTALYRLDPKAASVVTLTLVSHGRPFPG
jgi:hypothetical protein